jgi:hypothetical protein
MILWIGSFGVPCFTPFPTYDISLFCGSLLRVSYIFRLSWYFILTTYCIVSTTTETTTVTSYTQSGSCGSAVIATVTSIIPGQTTTVTQTSIASSSSGESSVIATVTSLVPGETTTVTETTVIPSGPASGCLNQTVTTTFTATSVSTFTTTSVSTTTSIVFIPIIWNNITNNYDVELNGTLNDYSNYTGVINLNVTGNQVLNFNRSASLNVVINVKDNATLNTYIYGKNVTTTCSNATTTVTPPVFITSSLIPECHNVWDIALVTLVIIFGILALIALAALAFLLLKRPYCSVCRKRHKVGSKDCPNTDNPPQPVPSVPQYAAKTRRTGDPEYFGPN